MKITPQPATPEGRKANSAVLSKCITLIATATGRQDKKSSRQSIENIAQNLSVGYSFGMECIRRGGAGTLDPEIWSLFLGIRKSFLTDMERAYIELGGSLKELKGEEE